MIEFLFLLLALSMAFVNEKERLTSAIFTVFTLSFYFINEVIPDNSYYILAASYDLFMMFVMWLFLNSENQKMTKYLCISCFCSILIQLIGWRLYVMHGNGHIYNYMAILFYICVILLFISRTRLNDKFAGNNDHHHRFLRDNFRRA